MNDFFALMARMKYIERWGLMRSSISENVQEHSHMVAMIAHSLAVIRRDVYKIDCEPYFIATRALYHDASEILTGDLPTPIKYYSEEISVAYKKVEEIAVEKLMGMLPYEMRAAYEPILRDEVDEETEKLVKAADRLSAYIKCVDERKAGNKEFQSAEKQTMDKLKAMEMQEVEYFLKFFMPAFEKNLDELTSID